MESKIRIKIGPIEVEYEGSQEFMKKELPELIRTVSELYSASNLGGEGNEGSGAGGQDIQMSIKAIATKLSCKSGADLAIAAAAHLTLVKKTKIFSRKTLLAEMQTASSYYKSSYSANLTTTLNSLLKSKFNEPKSGNYALTEGTKEELRSKLDQ